MCEADQIQIQADGAAADFFFLFTSTSILKSDCSTESAIPNSLAVGLTL